MSMTSISRWLGRVADIIGRFTGWFASLMVLVTCYIVVTRYVFDMGSVAIQELATYFNAFLFTLGAAYTLKEDAHVRVDIFYGPASMRSKALINIVGIVLLLFPVCIFLGWICWDYVAASFAIREKSGDTGGLPWVYLLKSMMLVMPVLLIVQGLSELLRNLDTVLQPDSALQTRVHEEHVL